MESNDISRNRSSHRRYSMKKGVLKNFARFTGKQLFQSLKKRLSGLSQRDSLLKINFSIGNGIFHSFFQDSTIHSQVLFKIGVRKNFAKYTVKYLCLPQSLFNKGQVTSRKLCSKPQSDVCGEGVYCCDF